MRVTPLAAGLALGLLAAALAAADPAKPAPKGKPNRLAGEVSPYLLQHAHNPVDWYPWGPEAFAKAKADNKLVFLSIGYSACHWCHVMERESFADAGIAATLNKHFVCIKVDREERPDVDEVYMAALQVMNQGGGWPLSMFLTADAKPIFGGTYWPPADVGEGDDKRSGFPTVLARVIELATKEREALTKQADKVADLTRESLDKSATDKRPDKLDSAWLAAAADAFEFDPVEGGFGQKMRLYRGTKFPRVPALSFLLRHAAAKPDAELDKSLRLTLDRLAVGGIRDHLGGGFHRYSTERTWTVPHFEKMLSDNAQLMELYADSFARTKQPQDADAVRDIARFVARDLTAPGGGFYSALDADASGEEGASYVWTKPELDRLLGDSPAAKQLRADLSLDGPPNFEKDRYIPRRKTLPDFARPEPAEVAALKAKLLAERDKRPQPFRDTKVLAGWNGQMVAGYARAGQVLNEPKFTAAAETAANFVLKTLRDPAGRLLRVYAGRPGEAPAARGTAFLDDYAYLVHGLLNLHESTKKPVWLAEARALTDQMAGRFGDPKSGAFTLTPNDGEKLFARGQDRYDGAQPSANGVAVRNLVRLAALTGDAKYKQAAEKALLAAGAQLRDAPTAVPTSAEALELWFAANTPKGR